MKLLVVDKIATHIFPGLTELGYSIHYHPDISSKEVFDIVTSYDALIFRSKLQLDKEFFSLPLKLQWIGRAGAGLDNIDEIEAKKKDIMIISAGEGNMNAVAEHALSILLSLINNVHSSCEEVKNYVWAREKNRGIELNSLKVGIVGFGKTGQTFANKLLLLGAKVYFYDIKHLDYSDLKYIDDSLHPRLLKVQNLSDIQDLCNVISVHTSLNESSRGMFGESFFFNCTHKIFFINTSRGETVMTKALLEALKQGQVKGAALDVLENEKMDKHTENEKEIYNALFKMPNVLLTPHIAGWTKESFVKISDTLLEKITLKKRCLIE